MMDDVTRMFLHDKYKLSNSTKVGIALKRGQGDKEQTKCTHSKGNFASIHVGSHDDIQIGVLWEMPPAITSM